jgi:hypothetical protein
MSGEASEPGPELELEEHDDRPTPVAYDKGGVPIYILVAWVLFIIAYVVVMALLAWPDLRAWLAA